MTVGPRANGRDGAAPAGVPAGRAPGANPAGSGAESAAQLSDLQRELVACQRLALAGTTAAMMAHEVNNLMTPILARASDALAHDDPALWRHALDRSVVQVQKTIALCKHLLRLTDPADERDATSNVAAAVHEALEEAVRPFCKDGIELRVDVPAELYVRGRSLLLEQVLLNLLVNARAAMKGLRGSLAISARRDRGYVVIEVCDSGKGLTDDELATAYAPFLAAEAANDTTDWRRVGLGLHVCRLIAQEHGAALAVRANPDRGCTFVVRWPAAASDNVE